MSDYVKPLVRWKAEHSRLEPESAFPNEVWHLFVGRGKNPRRVATIWKNTPNRFTWSTWDKHGTGGENDVSESLEQAQALASLCAIRQGFI